VSDVAGGPWFDLTSKSKSVGILAAPAAHHAAFLDLLKRQRARNAKDPAGSRPG
jgi:hypothetical protein